ncbi:hypothetical protein [Actinacidiphila sp. bgisy167]
MRAAIIAAAPQRRNRRTTGPEDPLTETGLRGAVDVVILARRG